MADKQASKRKQPKYDDQFRASAVVMLESQGYPAVKGALAIVAKHLKVPERTLSRWAKGENNPPPAKLVTDKKRDLREMFVDEMYAIMGVLPERRDEASYQQLVTSMGIIFDKVRLLDGLPTGIIQITSELVTVLERQGMSAADVFQKMLDKAKARAEQHVDR